MSVLRLGRVIMRPSLRLKVTLGFSLAMGLLLAALGVFVYDRLRTGLDESLSASLLARAADVRALVKQSDTGLGEVGGKPLGRGNPALAGLVTGFVQVLEPGRGVLEQTPGIPHTPLLSRQERGRAAYGPIWITARPSASIGLARMLATPVQAQGTSMVVVVGASLHERDAALNRLLALMILGGPIALLLASILGYGVATLSLRGVEAMRARAASMSMGDPGGRLPVPVAADELRRLAITLNEMLDRNEAAFTRERRFVADASHELRSPLTVLKAEIEIALAGSGSAGELRAALASADAEVDRAAELARDLLTLAQGDHGEMVIEPAKLPVREVFEHVRARFKLRAATERRTLLISAPDGLSMTADPLRIEQALSNLLENALRHGEGTVVLFAERHDGLLHLHVTDEGSGFPDDYVARAFERFSRPDSARTNQGSGLGLSIVRGIARSHGGEAHIRNPLGGGADVWISLPDAIAGASADPHASRRVLDLRLARR